MKNQFVKLMLETIMKNQNCESKPTAARPKFVRSDRQKLKAKAKARA